MGLAKDGAELEEGSLEIGMGKCGLETSPRNSPPGLFSISSV
jgi:hypothetical protein